MSDNKLSVPRILFLAINFENWVAPTVYYEQQAIQRLMPESVFYGPGYRYHTNQVKDIIADYFGSNLPEAIFCYIDERRLLGEPLPQEVITQYDINSSLQVFPVGLKDIKIPKIAWINDFWHCSCEEWDEILLTNGFDLAFATYAPPFISEEIFKRFFSRSVRETIKFIPWPRAINPIIFKDYGLEKIYDITLLGARDSSFYPLREIMHGCLSQQKSLSYFSQAHPGYKYHFKGTALTGETYAKLINQSKIFASCTGKYNIPFIKLYEVLACKTVLMCDSPSGAEYLGLVNRKNFLAVTKNNFLEESTSLLEDIEEINRIARNGQKLFLDHHTIDIRAGEFLKTINNFLQGRPDDDWACLYPYGKKHKSNSSDFNTNINSARHIKEISDPADSITLAIWEKYGLNNRPNETPPIVTECPDLVMLRGVYLRQLAERYEAKYFAEVGTARGFQSFMWAQYLLETEGDGLVYTCDIDGMDKPIYKTPLTGDNIFTRRQLWQGSQQVHYIHFVHGDSSKLTKKIDHQLDMVFIDGEHSEEAVMKDFKFLLPHLHPGSIVIFDDCDERFPEVQKALKHISKQLQIKVQTIDFTPSLYKIAIIKIPSPICIAASREACAIQRDTDLQFEYWFKQICIPDILENALKEQIIWQGKSLSWEVCHEILAYQLFTGNQYSTDTLINLSNNRYELLDKLWPGDNPSGEALEKFYTGSAKILPWGHGVFLFDHNKGERRKNFLRRVEILNYLKAAGIESIVDYGAGGGHTTLLAKAMGFKRIVNYEYNIFLSYIAWRAKHIASTNHDGSPTTFITSSAENPLLLDKPVQAIICTDVVEHVNDPDALLDNIYNALEPGGVLVWVACFDPSISCHMHGHLRGREELLLAQHGFDRLNDLPVSYVGHTGVYYKRSSLTISNPERLYSDNSTQTTLPNQQDRIFLSPEEVYLASADRMDLVLSNLKALKSLQMKQVDTYVSVIGGLSGLNYLSVLEPKEIVFYDINETMVRYAHLIKALIEVSETHKEFISRIFCRSIDRFLEQTRNYELSIENQKQYLSLPFEKDLLEETLSLLSNEDKKIFERIISPYLNGDILYGKRNCCRLLPCWPIDQRVPVGGGEETGFDENGKRVPNTNSFFYGYGWLESAEAFNNVKSVLSHSNIKFIQFDLLKSKLIALLDPSNNVVLHISNIDDWFPDKWRERLKSWKAQIEDQNGKLTIISSHNGLQTLQADPHELAYRALIPHVAGKVVEVTHKVPWGFHEINRTNVTTTDYLANNYEADTTILHILIGEGLSPETLISVYQKALNLSRWVIILEHNRASKDWDTEKSTTFLDDEELLSLLEKASDGRNVKIIETKMISGEKDDKRNQFFVTDTGRKKVLLKHRVLLVADVPNWIFARHCRMLNRFLGDEFQFTIKVQGNHFREEDYDLIYPLEWNLVPPEHIKDPRKYVTGIRSHIWWPDLPFDQFIMYLLTNFQKVHVVSKRLFDIFRHAIPGVSYISHGVDTEFFKPTTQADKSGKKLRLGWAGNRDQLAKGFQEFVQPLGSLPDVELVFCGYADKNLTMEEMREFYDSLDAYVCTSGNNEGNNNPLMEAASMGRAIITTDNGTVPEYLQDCRNALIVQRKHEKFVNAVERLRNDPALRVRLGNAARESATRFWEWKERAEDYRRFFREAILRASSIPLLSSFKDTTILLSQGEKLYAEGELQGALETFSKAIAIDPNYAQAYNNIGVVHWKAGNNLDALKNFRNAFELDPNDADALMNIADLFISMGKRQEAEQLLSSYLDNHPECVAAQDMFFMIKATNSNNNITESQTTDDAHPENTASNKKKGTGFGLVSIIIPTFNCREWVCDAIGSSLNQTYKNCEVIVIDDGSIDDTLTLLSKRYGNRIKYIFQKNKGLAAARNRGIDEANGEYIQFLDSDDVISPYKIEIQVNALKDVPGYSVSYSDYTSINIYDNSVNMSRYLTPRTNADSFFHSFITDWETRFSIPIHCFLFRSSIFHDLNIKFDVSLPNHEDWDCWVRIFASNPSVIHIDQKLAVYRIKPSTMCSDRALMRYGFMQSIYKYMVQYQNDPEILALLKIKKSEMEKCYCDVSAADTWETYKNMSAKNVSQKVTCVNVTDSKHSPVTLIAFYLPQYHPIPDNDQWWGKGFTEWTNVAKARPLFPGHYQPHLPADLGFYDLRLPETQKAQAELAQKYGIYGFCYYHYWFNGKILLGYPLQQVLKSGEPNFPFCLCWANENWTRAWDGRDSDILIRQNYSSEDDINHIRYLSDIFKDSRYIKIDGKPLFIVYRASNLPDPIKTTSLWREEARKVGIGELFLCRVERFVEDMKDPRPLGFDAAIEFQPDGINLGKPFEDPKFGDNFVYEYASMVKAALLKKDPGYLRFPCVCPSWDNSPRRQKKAVIFHNSTPQLYESWLKEILNRAASRRPEERIVFLNAFNEWGEGCHLEPDQMAGRAYLEATHRAILSCKMNDRNIHRETSQYLDGKAGAGIRHEVHRSATIDISSGDNPRVSIIIPLFNKLEFTKQCLESLIDNTPDELYEVVIVDNASTDGTKEFLNMLEGDVTIIRNKTNMGFAHACNQGAAASKGSYLLFLNNDTEPQKGWLEPLIEILDNDPTVAAAGSKLLFPDGTIQHAGVAIIEDKKLPDPLVARHIYYQQPTDLPEANQPRTYQALTAACIIIRKDAFKKVGGFDEGYWNGYEDVDICFKLQKNRWKLVYQPESVVIHHESISGPERFKKIKHNIEHLHKKWIGKIKPDGIINEDGSNTLTDTNLIQPYVINLESKPEIKPSWSITQNSFTSIIMLTFNQLEYTKECLQSIAQYTSVPYELIIVDNGSTDGTQTFLEEYAKGHNECKIIINKENLGFAAGNNQALQKAGGDYVLLLNNDVVVTEHWLERMIFHLERHPDIGMVGPMSNSVSGPQLVENITYGKDMKTMHTFARNFTAGNMWQTYEVMRLVGFCLLIKKDVIDIIGCLDENYGSGNFEDDDLCLRCAIAGYKNIIAHDVFVHHYGSMTFKGNAIDYQAKMNGNLKYFTDKWKDILEVTGNTYTVRMTKEKQLKQINEWGEARFSQRDFKIAVKIFERVLKLDRSNSQALNNLGVIQWQLGDAVSAMKTFQTALSFNHTDSDALGNLLQAAMETGRFDLIDPVLLETLRQAQPENSDTATLVNA